MVFSPRHRLHAKVFRNAHHVRLKFKVAAKSLGLVTDDHCIVMVWADYDDDTNQPSAFVDDV